MCRCVLAMLSICLRAAPTNEVQHRCSLPRGVPCRHIPRFFSNSILSPHLLSHWHNGKTSRKTIPLTTSRRNSLSIPYLNTTSTAATPKKTDLLVLTCSISMSSRRQPLQSSKASASPPYDNRSLPMGTNSGPLFPSRHQRNF